MEWKKASKTAPTALTITAKNSPNSLNRPLKQKRHLKRYDNNYTSKDITERVRRDEVMVDKNAMQKSNENYFCHIVIPCKNFEESKLFFEKVFGCVLGVFPREFPFFSFVYAR